MTPWHRFWFPDGDATPPPTRDTALWSPQVLAETQRELWQQATDATEAWWRYWRLGWPTLPMPTGDGDTADDAPAAAAAPARRGGARASAARSR